MKKKLVLVLATLMCISLCACGGSDTTNGDNKENVTTNQETDKDGFTPNQATETEETKKETVDFNMTVEEMQKYYDTEKFIGTPRLALMQSMPDTSSNTVMLHERNEKGQDMCINYIEMTGTKEDWYNEDRTGYKKVTCIVCDNNTPDDYEDDVVAYIFLD